MGEELGIETRMYEAGKRWGLEFKRKTPKEASASACPFCHLVDDDGFILWSNGRYWCRKCGKGGWLDENDPRPLTKDERLALRVQLLEQKQKEHERRISALERMAKCTDHISYHEAMTEAQREYWWEEGMMDETIDRYLLGHCQSCPTCPDSASYTIPIINRGKLENIRHRLETPNKGGKYRPHIAGLGVSLFNADLLDEARPSIVITEGEKKAIVATQYGFDAVGICGKRSFKREWLEWFDSIPIIYIALDPDANESAQRLAKAFKGRARVVNLPCKLDDMIVKYRASSTDIESFLRLSRPIRGSNDSRN